jgi:hypothetical protein
MVRHCYCNDGYVGVCECYNGTDIANNGMDIAKKELIEVIHYNPLDYNQKYYVTEDGHKITDKMTAGEIVSRFGVIRQLEAKGFKVIPV